MDAGMPGPALQDCFKVHCWGCGALNPGGLQIKSRWEDDELTCRWQPKPEHIGYPGIVYGGLIAAVVDCHAICAAMASTCRDAGLDMSDDHPPPFNFVTGTLGVKYLAPASIDRPLVLRARVVDAGERRVTVACRVLQDGCECVSAEVIAVRVKARG